MRDRRRDRPRPGLVARPRRSGARRRAPARADARPAPARTRRRIPDQPCDRELHPVLEPSVVDSRSASHVGVDLHDAHPEAPARVPLLGRVVGDQGRAETRGAGSSRPRRRSRSPQP